MSGFLGAVEGVVGGIAGGFGGGGDFFSELMDAFASNAAQSSSGGNGDGTTSEIAQVASDVLSVASFL
jgi:hypothetical protein